jgi:hypothetical protein
MDKFSDRNSDVRVPLTYPTMGRKPTQMVITQEERHKEMNYSDLFLFSIGPS